MRAACDGQSACMSAGTTDAQPLVAILLALASVGCAPVDCPAGYSVSNGKCVKMLPPDATSSASEGDVATVSGGAVATSMQGGGAANGVPSADASADVSAGSSNQGPGDSNAPGSQGTSEPSCALEGSVRCAVTSKTTLETCVGGIWTAMLVCAEGQRCASPSPGMAECTTAAVDCNGLLCNGECVTNDEKNCGTCGHDCTSLPNVSGATTCQQGICAFEVTSCESGFAHCSENADDGCETKLSGEENCGGCGVKCPPATPVCALATGTSAYACDTGCSQDAPVLCGASCIDPMSDAQHCGDCNMACPPVNDGQPVCAAGMCTMKCNFGYHLCGDSCVSDNSADTCGTQCEPCKAPIGATATCDGMRCGFACRDDGDLKCDDGCYPSDDTNCGGCGNDCLASGEVCDGRICVECRTDSDCGGPSRYCVGDKCKACKPGSSNTCGDCEECSPQGSCVSNGPSQTCYRDSDGDGYGDRSSPRSSCGECPSGTVEDDRDCFDDDRDVHPGQTAYFERGYGSGAANFDYNCNGVEEPKTTDRPGWRSSGCACDVSGVCSSGNIETAPCGATGIDCIGSKMGACTCDAVDNGVVQGCR